jgi:uncharacterized protein YkvS
MRLFRPAWNSKNPDSAVKAVAKIKDEAKLARIAKEAWCWQACVAAVERITNPVLLADVARNDKGYSDVRKAAVERLTDQSVLVDVARNDKCFFVRLAAVERLTDPSVLADVARNDNDNDVRKAAVERLTDQSVLAYVARNDKYYSVRLAAVERLTDPSVLADIARNDRDSYVRKAAVERLTDPGVLADIARDDKEDRDIRIAASHRLVNYDPEDDLLTYIIRMLGGILKNSDDERMESREKERRNAAEILLAYYRRYGKSKQGEAIRLYKGEYKGGYSDHIDFHGDAQPLTDDYPEHEDYYYTDTRYTIYFSTEEANQRKELT